MNRTYQQTYYLPGALTADLDIRFIAHTNIALLHVSAGALNDTPAKLSIGNGDDPHAYLNAASIGALGAPVQCHRTDFVNEQFPRIQKGESVILYLDHDGSAGTPAEDVTLVLTFAEG